MIKRNSENKLIIAIFVIFSFLSFTYKSYAADISLIEDKTVKKGEVFYVDVKVTSNVDVVNSVAFRFGYDSQKISYVGSSRDGSLTDMWLSPLAVSSSDGFFESGIISKGISSDSFQVLRLFFLAKSTGTTNIKSISGIVYKDDGIPTDVLNRLLDAQITILENNESQENAKIEDNSTSTGYLSKDNFFDDNVKRQTGDTITKNVSPLDGSQYNDNFYVLVADQTNSIGQYEKSQISFLSNCYSNDLKYQINSSELFVASGTVKNAKNFVVDLKSEGNYYIDFTCGNDLFSIYLPIRINGSESFKNNVYLDLISNKIFYSEIINNGGDDSEIVIDNFFQKIVIKDPKVKTIYLHLVPGKTEISIIKKDSIINKKFTVWWQIIVILIVLLSVIIYKKYGKNN